METTKRPPSPQPAGAPRWVALYHRPSSASWQVCAESPHRAPVEYALGEMAQTVRARGGDLAVSLWGPKDGAWQRFDAPVAPTPAPTGAAAAATGSPPADGPDKRGGLAERMDSRRRQVLLAGLSKAGLYDLAPDDQAAVRTLVERLDETTVRQVAQWLAAAGRGPTAGP